MTPNFSLSYSYVVFEHDMEEDSDNEEKSPEGLSVKI